MVTRFQQFGRTVLLSALVLGLNVLGLLALTHARHPNHVRANVAHGHHGSMRSTRRVSGGQSTAEDSRQTQVDRFDGNVATVQHHAAPPSFVAVLPSELLQLFTPEFVDAPLQSVPEMAVGSAARAPGSPRGPPTA